MLRVCLGRLVPLQHVVEPGTVLAPSPPDDRTSATDRNERSGERDRPNWVHKFSRRAAAKLVMSEPQTLQNVRASCATLRPPGNLDSCERVPEVHREAGKELACFQGRPPRGRHCECSCYDHFCRCQHRVCRCSPGCCRSPALCEEGEHIAEVPGVVEQRLVGGVVLERDADVLGVAAHVNHLRCGRGTNASSKPIGLNRAERMPCETR